MNLIWVGLLSAWGMFWGGYHPSACKLIAGPGVGAAGWQDAAAVQQRTATVLQQRARGSCFGRPSGQWRQPEQAQG
jgi:hypothetical protein